MKLRLASPNLSAFFHRPTHLGQYWRGHEGVFRVIQLVLMVVVALFCAKLIAGGAVMALRAFSSFLS